MADNRLVCSFLSVECANSSVDSECRRWERCEVYAACCSADVEVFFWASGCGCAGDVGLSWRSSAYIVSRHVVNVSMDGIWLGPIWDGDCERELELGDGVLLARSMTRLCIDETRTVIA